MGADVDNPQFARHEHHREVLRAGELGEYLGVAWILEPPEVHSLLIQGSCRDGLRASFQRQLRRPADILESRRPGTRVELTERQILRQLAHRENIHAARLEEGFLRPRDLVYA